MAIYKYDRSIGEVVCVSESGGHGAPDIYFKGPYFDENISHPDMPGFEKGTMITSRRQKATVLKMLGLREAGDRHHGSSGFDRIAHRHAMESLRRKQ